MQEEAPSMPIVTSPSLPDIVTQSPPAKEPSSRVLKNHPAESIIGGLEEDAPPAPTAHATLDELVFVAENVSIDSPASDSVLKEVIHTSDSILDDALLLSSLK
ncbi:hypothetical protein H6P81_006271 [Aristolochia fimbriata]|uniref:Uncharacterized protein n=1 Tax=Aristolochia fimbriata TaxID=158543 RepID=A0AAV7EWZ9_ARIFI|nr:hypothetical protein H6P81_006271 [Aristolochia fimbriata]